MKEHPIDLEKERKNAFEALESANAAQAARITELEAKLAAIEAQRREWPTMGFGKVAVGRGYSPANKRPCLVYLRLNEVRRIGQSAEDIYPVGSEAREEDLLALVRFATPESVRQTIGILNEIIEQWPDPQSTMLLRL